MPALIDYNAGMKEQAKKQYTIRGVSTRLDMALKQKAKTEGKSLNAVLVESLQKSVGDTPELMIHHDLDGLIGKWEEDPEFDRVLEEQNKVDEEMWR